MVSPEIPKVRNFLLLWVQSYNFFLNYANFSAKSAKKLHIIPQKVANVKKKL